MKINYITDKKALLIAIRLLLQLDKKKRNANLYISRHTGVVNYLPDYGLNVKRPFPIKIIEGSCLLLRQLERV